MTLTTRNPLMMMTMMMLIIREREWVNKFSKDGKRASSSKGITTMDEYVVDGSFEQVFSEIMIIEL